MAEVNNLQDWVTSEMVRGRYIFTKEDVLGLHLPISDQALQNSGVTIMCHCCPQQN